MLKDHLMKRVLTRNNMLHWLRDLYSTLDQKISKQFLGRGFVMNCGICLKVLTHED